MGSVERATSRAQRIRLESCLLLSLRHHAAACPPTPAKSHTSAHSPLGTAQRADWETGTHHLSVAINPPLHFCWRASNTLCVAHRVRIPPRNPTVVCAVGMKPALHECCSFCAQYSLARFTLHTCLHISLSSPPPLPITQLLTIF